TPDRSPARSARPGRRGGTGRRRPHRCRTRPPAGRSCRRRPATHRADQHRRPRCCWSSSLLGWSYSPKAAEQTELRNDAATLALTGLAIKRQAAGTVGTVEITLDADLVARATT